MMRVALKLLNGTFSKQRRCARIAGLICANPTEFRLQGRGRHSAGIPEKLIFSAPEMGTKAFRFRGSSVQGAYSLAKHPNKKAGTQCKTPPLRVLPDEKRYFFASA
jgi:hypothetical protein